MELVVGHELISEECLISNDSSSEYSCSPHSTVEKRSVNVSGASKLVRAVAHRRLVDRQL